MEPFSIKDILADMLHRSHIFLEAINTISRRTPQTGFNALGISKVEIKHEVERLEKGN